MRGPNERMIVMRLDDKECRGDIVVEKVSNGFIVWLQIEDLHATVWEKTETYATLSDAMLNIADIIKLNAENDFYE